MHHAIEKILNSNFKSQEKLEKLKRLAFDTAEMQVADEENMPGPRNQNPELNEIITEINKLSTDQKFKIADFLPRK